MSMPRSALAKIELARMATCAQVVDTVAVEGDQVAGDRRLDGQREELNAIGSCCRGGGAERAGVPITLPSMVAPGALTKIPMPLALTMFPSPVSARRSWRRRGPREKCPSRCQSRPCPVTSVPTRFPWMTLPVRARRQMPSSSLPRDEIALSGRAPADHGRCAGRPMPRMFRQRRRAGGVGAD